MNRPRLLFISHSASRNGASILLLNFLRWLKTRVDWDIEVLVDGPGPLVAEYRTICKTTVLRSAGPILGVVPRRWQAAVEPRLKRWWARSLFLGRHFDLVYANTAAAWPCVEALRRVAPSLIWHIHELSYALALEIPHSRAQDLFDASSAFIVVSGAVRETVIAEYGVDRQKVAVVHGFAAMPDVTAETRRARRLVTVRALGWPDDAFVVGGCGTLGWRKGTDLFLQIAQQVLLAEGSDRVRFLWVGGETQGRDALEFEHDLHALGLDGRCARVPAVADMLDYYCAMDTFALTSREDPFPLVMLEAGAHQLPVVCFADSGGGPDFVGSDAGLIAPCRDVAAFTNRLLRLRDMPGLRHSLGHAASTKVRMRHTLETQAPALLQVVERCLHRSRATADSGEVRALSVPPQRRPQEQRSK